MSMKDNLSNLNNDDQADLDGKIRWVKGFIKGGAEDAWSSYEGKLLILAEILKSSFIKPDETLKLQCLGAVYGECLREIHGLEWKEYEDEYGRDHCLSDPISGIVLFPLTMISKRIEDGEPVDVFEMANWIGDQIRRFRNGAAQSE